MKRLLKKLTLNRETLGNLGEERLGAAVAGSGPTCTPSCNTLCLVCPGPSQNDLTACKTC
jgi:hypothetical protein